MMAVSRREERGEDDGGSGKRANGGVTVTDIILVIDHYGEQTRSSLRSTAASLHFRIWCTVCTC